MNDQDTWAVLGNYGGQCGWEVLTFEATREDAVDMLRCYNENEPQYPHRIRPAGEVTE